MALKRLSDRLYRYYGRKVLIFLDEYDTPMQEAFVPRYWDEMVNLFRRMIKDWFAKAQEAYNGMEGLSDMR